MKNKLFVYILMFVLLLSGSVLAADGIPVKVIEPQVKTVELNRVMNGVIEPVQNILLSAKVGGVVEDLRVRVGEQVQQGEIILVFEQDQLQVQIKQAEAAVELARANLEMLLKGASDEDRKLAETSYQQAEISYESAQKNLEFANNLFEDRTMQKQQLLAAETQLESARVQLKLTEERYTQAELALKLAKEDYERMSHLYENDVITAQQFEGIEAQYENAKSNLASAELAKEQARVGYEGAVDGYELAEDAFNNRLSAEQQVTGANTQVDMAKVSLQIAQVNLEKLNKGASAEQIRISQANVKQAEAALELVKLQLENSIVKSPVDGIIAQLNVDEGEMAGPGTPVAMLIDIDQVYLKLDVTADILTSLKIGQEVEVRVLALNNEFRRGQIELISPMVDARTQAYPIKILLENADQRIKPGMFADANLIITQSQNTVVVPIETVFDLEGSPYIYVAKLSADGKSGVAEKRMIKVGLVNNQEVEIIGGVTAAEKVVSEGQFTLKDGDVLEVTL